MECRRGLRRAAPILGLLLAWLLTNCTVFAGDLAEGVNVAYACEGKMLEMQCQEGHLIRMVRANYGRFSVTVCNDEGETEWSVNCMAPKTMTVLTDECNRRNSCTVATTNDVFGGDPCPGTPKYIEAQYECIVESPSRCNDKQNCSIVASTQHFGDPCPNTGKYLEAHFRCLSTTTTTTPRPSPPWLLTTQPIWSTAKTTTVRIPDLPPDLQLPPDFPSYNPQQPDYRPPYVPAMPITPASHTSTKATVEKTEEEDQSLVPPENGPPAKIPPMLTVPETTVATTTTTFAPWRRTTAVPSTLEHYDYGKQACPAVMARNLSWNRTKAGDVAVQSCPGGANGLARWRCVEQGESAVWQRDSPDLSECRSVWLTSLENRVSDGDVILGVSRELSQVTNNTRGLYGGDMMITTKIIKNMAEKMAVDIRTFQDPHQREVSVQELLQGVLRTGSNLLDKAQMASWKDLSHQEQMRVATSLLTGLEENAFLLAETLTEEKTIIQQSKNILVEVRVLDARNMGDERQVFPSEETEQKWTVSSDRVELTKGALLDNSDNGIVRLVFMAFDKLEEILQPQEESLSGLTSDDTQPRKNRLLNTKVISASLGKGRHIQLSEPVRVCFKHLTVDNVTNPTCAFWDYTLSSWADEGCKVIKTNKTHTECECNHLTNFAVLMDVHAVLLDGPHKIVLQVTTYTGCIISIVCFVLTILTFHFFRVLKSDRTIIHKNLCTCLLIAEILFVCGINQTDQRVICGVVAGSMHYFFLCAFFWMFLEGFQIYVMVIEVFESEKSRIRWYYLFAYCIPALIVMIACAIDPLSYGMDRYCWLRADNYFIFSFVGPVILVLVANLIFLSMAIFMMCRHSKTVAMKNQEHSQLARANGKEENALPNKLQAHLTWLRGSIVLVFLLGLTWTFGLLYLNQETVMMAYLFTILNSLQGLFIFVFLCVQNEKVRNEYRKFVRDHPWVPKCLRSSMTAALNGSADGSGGTGGANGGKDFVLHNTSSNPSAPTTDSSGASSHSANYLVSGRSLAVVDRQPAITMPGELTSNEAHIVASLPHARHAFLPSAPNIPQSATWGHLNKNLTWKNISFKSHSRDSGHGSEQEDSPRMRNTLTHSHSNRRRGAANNVNDLNTGVRMSGGRRAAMPYNHTYTEIADGRGSNGSNGRQVHSQRHGQHVRMPRGFVNEDDPVYEEIERNSGVVGSSEIHMSDMSDEDGRRQSDMSRQSSRSYGDHRPLIQYSSTANRNLPHYGQTVTERGSNGGNNLAHYDSEYGPTMERTMNACWEKLRRQQAARYELGDLPRLPAGYGMPPQQDHTRTVAVLDGHTVVCHLQPQTGRGMPPPSYSEC